MYFLAIAAFACHDYQSATYFFDAAATEDFNVPDTENQPAHLFMRLDPSNPKQAGRVFPSQARRATETSATAIWLMDSSVTFADAAVPFNPGVDWHDVI